MKMKKKKKGWTDNYIWCVKWAKTYARGKKLLKLN